MCTSLKFRTKILNFAAAPFSKQLLQLQKYEEIMYNRKMSMPSNPSPSQIRKENPPVNLWIFFRTISLFYAKILWNSFETIRNVIWSKKNHIDLCYKMRHISEKSLVSCSMTSLRNNHKCTKLMWSIIFGRVPIGDSQFIWMHKFLSIGGIEHVLNNSEPCHDPH